MRTRVAPESRRAEVYDFVRREVAKGRQAYIIYPLVEETEKSDLKAAAQMAEHLGRDVFPELRLGLLHGRMRPEEKEAVMRAFKARETDILVATTVIEVGIDVPNATVMVIDNANSFGLAQLHQLRGRIGRGAHDSYCILVSRADTLESKQRLKILAESNDGFKIAEADMQLRGPGELLGQQQSGMPPLRFGNLVTDAPLILHARDLAKCFLRRTEA